MLTSTITQKGQVTIPKQIRNVLNLKTNDQVVFVRRGNDIVIKPVRDILDLRGTIKVKGVQDYNKIRETVRSDIAKRVADE